MVDWSRKKIDYPASGSSNRCTIPESRRLSHVANGANVHAICGESYGLGPYDSPQIACVQRWMSMLRMFSLTPLAACSAIIDSACIRIKSSLTRTFRCGCGQVHCQRYTWSGQELHHETTSTLRQVGVHHPIWPGWLSLVWWYARQTGTWNKPQFAHSPGCCSTPLNSIIWKYFSRGYPTGR